MEYFVGAHLAELLKKETFNLYSSLKRRNIATRNGDAWLLHLLISKSLVFAGTTSLTLVRVDQVSEFVDDALAKIEQRKAKRTKGGKRERDESIDAQVSKERECAGLLISLAGVRK